VLRCFRENYVMIAANGRRVVREKRDHDIVSAVVDDDTAVGCGGLAK